MEQEDPLAERARKNRQRLSANWESESTLGRRLPAGELRRSGRLLGVWVAEAGEYRFPAFQFEAPGPHFAKMAEVLGLLRASHNTGASGWSELEWFLMRRSSLGGLAPAEIFSGNPELVVRIAREDGSGADGGGW